MPEPHASNTEDHTGSLKSLNAIPAPPASNHAPVAATPLPLPSATNTQGSPSTDTTTSPFLENALAANANTPLWIRPFFSLRIQLIATYIISLLLVVALVCLLIYRQSNLFYISGAALVVIFFGSLIALTMITLLLRPLWRVTDVAQAIAVGDLKQRKRLPMRQPPQDEIDRLAGSLNEMVLRLEKAEELQHASEQRFTRFFSDASHQLRTPLTSIRGFTEVLMRGAKDDPDTAQRVLKRMKSEAERMTALINDLLTLARLDDTQLLKKQYVDLVDLANDSIAYARMHTNAERSISLLVNTQESYGLQADKERLKQLFFILLDNALKYGRQTPDGQITLQLTKHENQAMLQVIDNGSGISAIDMEHIFDAFYRGAPPSTTPTSAAPPVGVGLGLTIAAAITRAHEGSITAVSEPGKGSTFSVVLPCLT
ncbi:MAG TPA: HAMP domain-containing sensor histidine kinase [Ktedonobacteraceae bacterium]|jgi:two-component system OmpR family sensor kinase|nr:HAMP domain-containing sensor histidine kinase [Ktedonobacteraceae bacterium]